MNNINKDEYVILSQMKNNQSNNIIKYQIKNKLCHKKGKILFILFFSLISISLIFLISSFNITQYHIELNTKINNTNISSSEDFINITLQNETYKTFENGIKLTYLTKEMVDKFNSYTNSCVNNILIDKKKYPLVKHPKISAIIPIYNGGKYLHYSLRSVQNQKMKDIEIILIDDCSTDDSLSIIENYMKEDERIRLIKNFENRKILYSKSFAALNSKGKYIIQLDQDDIFIREDVFDILYYEAEKEDLDLVNIRDIYKSNYEFKNLTRVNYANRHYIFPKKTHYKNQTELKDQIFIDGNNMLLWGLLIKSDIYKKAVYHLWPIIINYKIIFHEDYTIIFMLILLSQKYKYLNHFGLIHLKHLNATSESYYNNKNYYLSLLFCGNNFFDYHINNNPKDIKMFTHFHSLFKIHFNIGKDLFPKLHNLIMNKVINNEYLSKEKKEYFEKKININNSEYIDNFVYETIYNYQISNLNNNKSNITYISDPIISIIIFCTESKYLDKTINSIQNQNFTKYEIILIYDNKEQNDIDSIQKFIKKNQNINLINNKNKKGLIYSISVGVLSSRGKYILILEPSNTLAKQNTLNELYNGISDGNIDILEFNLLINNQENIYNNSLILYKCHHYKSNINLDAITYNKDFLNIDIKKDLLINKLIKADLFKNTIKEYNLNETKNEVYNYYDDIFLYVLQKSKNNFNHINNFGVIKKINNTNSLIIKSIIEDQNQKIKDSIFYINFLFEKSYNSFEEKKFVLNEFFNVMSIIFNKFNSKCNEAYILYEKFLNCDYISQLDKNYLKFYYNSLIN